MRYRYTTIDDEGIEKDRITCDDPIELIKTIFAYEKILYELRIKEKC